MNLIAERLGGQLLIEDDGRAFIVDDTAHEVPSVNSALARGYWEEPSGPIPQAAVTAVTQALLVPSKYPVRTG